MSTRAHSSLYLFFLVALVANVGLWIYSSPRVAHWANVPPAPGVTEDAVSFLGDTALAYRVNSIMLQTFGNTSGDGIPLKDYNYKNLRGWFALSDKLDPQSNYVPNLAAYYFSGSQDVANLPYVIDYLRVVGLRPDHDKYMFMGQAIFLARHKLEDPKLAKVLAKELAANYRKGMPGWTLQMESLIESDLGEKDTAYLLMLQNISEGLKSGMDPIEIHFMLDYICSHLKAADEKSAHPVCTKS